MMNKNKTEQEENISFNQIYFASIFSPSIVDSENLENCNGADDNFSCNTPPMYVAPSLESTHNLIESNGSSNEIPDCDILAMSYNELDSNNPFFKDSMLKVDIPATPPYHLKPITLEELYDNKFKSFNYKINNNKDNLIPDLSSTLDINNISNSSFLPLEETMNNEENKIQESDLDSIDMQGANLLDMPGSNAIKDILNRISTNQVNDIDLLILCQILYPDQCDNLDFYNKVQSPSNLNLINSLKLTINHDHCYNKIKLKPIINNPHPILSQIQIPENLEVSYSPQNSFTLNNNFLLPTELTDLDLMHVFNNEINQDTNQEFEDNLDFSFIDSILTNKNFDDDFVESNRSKPIDESNSKIPNEKLIHNVDICHINRTKKNRNLNRNLISCNQINNIDNSKKNINIKNSPEGLLRINGSTLISSKIIERQDINNDTQSKHNMHNHGNNLSPSNVYETESQYCLLRKRNNEASRKCRALKKEKLKRMKEDVQRLIERKEQFENTIKILEESVKQVKQALLGIFDNNQT